jgi:DNA-binding NtrC family response regulator
MDFEKEIYKVLVIEDEPDLVELMITHLESRYDVKIFHSVDGIDAQFKLNNDKFNLVILDFNIPKVPGTQILKRIYAKEFRFKPDKVIVISGMIDEEACQKFQDKNIPSLMKPLNYDDLDKILEGIVPLKE